MKVGIVLIYNENLLYFVLFKQNGDVHFFCWHKENYHFQNVHIGHSFLNSNIERVNTTIKHILIT